MATPCVSIEDLAEAFDHAAVAPFIREFTDYTMRTRWRDLPHCSEVKFKMTDGFSIGADIGFLAEHDLVDQLRGLTVSRRQPRDLDTCEVALQSLDQRHEIPSREDVRLHEGAQRANIADRQRQFDFELIKASINARPVEAYESRNE